MKGLKKEEKNGYLPIFTDRFFFFLFYLPQVVFVKVENVQAECQKTSDGELPYIWGRYEIWIGLQKKERKNDNYQLRVFTRNFLFLINPSTGYGKGYPEIKELQCETKHEIQVNRLWKLPFSGKTFFIPWKIAVKVQLLFRESQKEKFCSTFLPENEENNEQNEHKHIIEFFEEELFAGFTLAEAHKAQEEEKNRPDLTIFGEDDAQDIEIVEVLDVEEEEDKEKEKDLPEVREDLADLIALDGRSKKTSQKLLNSHICPPKRKKRYLFYDIVLRQWESEKNK